MRVFQLPQRRQSKQTAQTSSTSASFYGMWDAVARFAKEIRASEFMAEMIRRRNAYGSEGVMGAIDCATLYGLTRWLRPMVLVESGGFIGMSSAFILKALADEKLATSKLYSIELSEDCEQGALIPEELRPSGGFVPMRGRIEDFLKGDQLPRSIDMFLHDSSHSYQHMLWEFRQFWPRLRDGGLLVLHVHVRLLSAAIACWNAFAAVILVLDWMTIRTMPQRKIRERAQQEDLSRLVVFIFVVVASFAALCAVVFFVRVHKGQMH